MSRRDTIRRAKDVIAARHEQSISDFNRHIAEARANIPGFSECDSKIAGTGLRIMSASIGHDTTCDIDQIHEEYSALVAKKRELLKNAGYPVDYCDIHFSCDKCSDTGYCGIHICDCLKNEIVRASLEDSGLYYLTESQSFDTFSLDYYQNRDKIMMAKNCELLKEFAGTFVAGKSDSFLFLGGTGLGKTHLSTAVASEVIKRGAYVVYESAIKLFSDFEMKQFGRDLGNGSSSDTERYFDADLLIVDDLGCEMSSTFTVSCLYNLINRRMLTHQSTIISTNLTQNELQKRYTDRIISRIFGEYKPLIFSGTDIREQKVRRQVGQKKQSL